MLKTLITYLFLIIMPTSTFAWWETIVDTVETRYPNGQLHQQYQQVTFGGNEKTSKTGFYRSWYENGRMGWDGRYTGDKESCTWVHWDSTGRRVEEISYKAGFKHGDHIVWNPNGTMRTALHYRQDKLHGLCTWYTTTNNINGEYNNPCLSIVAKRFYVDGLMLLPIHDTTDSPCIEGLVGGQEPYHNIENDLWIEWNLQNTEFYVGRMVDGKKHGVWILWTADGDMKRVDVYDHGVPSP
nr:hypothetical protein [candidate division Zixibacteria bacterium]